MQLLTGEQMRRVDRRAIDQLGVPGSRLMENAGAGVARALARDEPERLRGRSVVLCGPGNNGGDGFVIARHLLAARRDTDVVLLCPADRVKGDAAVALGRLQETGATILVAGDDAGWERCRGRLAGASLVVDAMLGTGVRGGARGLTARVIDDVNAGGCYVCSVDLPSGLDADSAETPARAIRARRTYTLCRPKPALAFDPAALHCGIVRVIDIGMPEEAVRAERTDRSWIDRGELAPLVGVRERDAAGAHKGRFGHLLAVAGSRGKSGAAVLTARGALRAGVGLVTVATPASVQSAVAMQQAEAMTEPLAETADGVLSAAAAQAVSRLLDGKSALALGPGLGRHESTRDAVLTLLGCSGPPTVVDADALNAIAGAASPWTAATGRPTVLTPHPGEAARLLDCTSAEVQADRPTAAVRLAERTRAVVVLKGRRTLVADAAGTLAVNATGNAGMATAGTGDVLTGVVGALLARGLSAWDAARVAVWIHGTAGDRAARDVGTDGMIATDLAERLPLAFRDMLDPDL